MKANYKRMRTKFGPETRFTVEPKTSRSARHTQFEGLKVRLLLERLEEIPEARLSGPLHQAANEAAALAWITAYPLLVFPVLFEEKTFAALARAERQEEVRQRSRELLAV